jgi:hypothetical protein
VIPQRAISITEQVLRAYGGRRRTSEGLVYWGGAKDGNTVRVLTVIAPQTTSAPRRVVATNTANARVVNELVDHRFVYLAQIHSHPGDWVDHSDGDDEWAAFKHDGLLSLVVPDYGRGGMLPLAKCGVHRYQGGEFKRFSDEYVENHFELSELEIQFFDLR